MSEAATMADATALLHALDRRIAFHCVFVTLTGSVKAALMLSQAWHWQTYHQAGAWWCAVRDDWTPATGLTRSEQEGARTALAHVNLLESRLAGIPAKLHYRVNLSELVRQLGALQVGGGEEARR